MNSKQKTPENFKNILIEEYLEGEIQEILQNNNNQLILDEMREESTPSEEEKEDLEIEFFGQKNVMNEIYTHSKFKNKSIEEIIIDLNDEVLKLNGKIKNYKEDIKDLKFTNKELKNKDYLLKRRYEKPKNFVIDQFISSYGKVPPQAIELEEQILTTFFHHPEWMEQFSQAYLNLMFYKEKNQLIHSSMMNKKSKISVENLAQFLRQIERLEVAGGKFELKKLANQEPIQNKIILEDSIKIIEQKYLAREVIRFGTEIITEAYNEKRESVKPKTRLDVKKINGRIERIRKEFEQTEQIDDFVEYIRDISFRAQELLPFRYRKNYSKKDQLEELITETKELIERKGKPIISTGYKELDKVTHGIRANKLYMFGARGKNGKTTFSVNIADNVAKQNSHAAIFSYEMSYKEILYKLISKRTNIDIEKFEYFDEDETTFSNNELEKIIKASEEIKKLPLEIIPEKPRSLDYTVAKCRNLKGMYPDLSLIVFDGLQSFEKIMPEKANRSYFFDHILTIMKALAEELDITVIINAQLKAEVETYKNKKPKGIGNFADCKAIPEIADGAFLLYRPEHYFSDKKYKNFINVHPVDLRSSGRAHKQFPIGIEIKYGKMYEIETKTIKTYKNLIEKLNDQYKTRTKKK